MRLRVILPLLVVAFAATAGAAAAFEPTFDDECLTDGFAKDKSVRHGGVVVHYTGRRNRAAAKRIASQAGGTIFPKYKKLLGRVPPSDRKEGCYHGGSGKLDIFVSKVKKLGSVEIPDGTLAFVHPYDPYVSCDPRHAVFAVVRPNVRKAVLAHELFHAFAAAYKTAGKCETYHEWDEALATWGGNYVYPRDNVEHAKDGAMLQPEYGIDFWDYPAWVFPYYVTQRFGAKSVRAMLEAKETYRWDAFMDKAIPGGFAARLPEFALYAYNQAPVPNAVGASFAQWDGFAAKPKSVPVVDPRLSGAHARVDPIAVAKDRIMALGREYRRIVVGDASIRQLTFLNPTAANPDLHVRALVKRADGSWRSENWDGRQAVSFCRDQPGQDVREIVLAYSNSGHLMAGQKFAAVKTSVRSEHTCALHYKVLSASINYHTEGAADSIVCGRQSGRITFGAAGGAQAYEPSMSIATRFGQVSGAVRARIPGGWSGHHVEGCTAGPNGLEPCTKDLPPVPPRPDGKADIRFSISGGANDPAWEMHWGMDPPYVGAVDSFDSCMVFISGQVPSSAQVRTVPRATMLQTKPVTLVFKGAMAVPVPVLANGTMSHSWNYTMTIQRVGADGTPLG